MGDFDLLSLSKTLIQKKCLENKVITFKELESFINIDYIGNVKKSFRSSNPYPSATVFSTTESESRVKITYQFVWKIISLEGISDRSG